MKAQWRNVLVIIQIILECEQMKSCLGERLTINSSLEVSSIRSFKLTMWSTLLCVPRIAITRIEFDDTAPFSGFMAQKPAAFVVPNREDNTYRILSKTHPCDTGTTSGS